MPFYKKISVHNVFLIVSIITLVGWYYYSFFYGERIWAGNGIGFDGGIYAKIAQEFPSLFINKDLSAYYIQHSLPGIIIYYTTNVFNVSLETPVQVISAFLIFQYLLIAVNALYLVKVAKHLQFSTQTSFLLYASIFITVPLLKKFLYAPVSNDVTALTIGLITFYYYIRKQRILLIIFSILGIFVFPSMIYVGAIFIFFAGVQASSQMRVTKTDTHFTYGIISIMALIIFWLLYTGFQITKTCQQINYLLIWLSVPLLLLYVYKVFREIPCFSFCKELMSKRVIFRVVLSVLFVVGMLLLFESIAKPQNKGHTLLTYPLAILYGAITNPLISIVNHIGYYGPMVILIMFYWKKIFFEIQKLGIAPVLFTILYVFMSLGRESRQFINAWPFFVIVTCVYLNKLNISWKFVYVFVLISIIFSRVWFTINIDGISFEHGYLTFPAQRFLMFSGPWMSTKVYVVQAIIVFLVSGLMYFFLRKGNYIQKITLSWFLK